MRCVVCGAMCNTMEWRSPEFDESWNLCTTFVRRWVLTDKKERPLISGQRAFSCLECLGWPPYGEMAEWTKATVLKTVVLPTPVNE